MSVIKKPKIWELERIVELHYKNLKDGILYRLGKPVLRFFYKEIFNDKGSFILAFYSGNRIIGAAASTKDTAALFKKIKSKYFIELSFRAVFRSFTDPMLLLRLILNEYPIKIKSELLFLFVENEFRGHGVGQKLVKSTTKRFKAMGVREYKITIFSSNVRGKKFYERLRFKHGGQFSSFNEKRDIYYYKITE